MRLVVLAALSLLFGCSSAAPALPIVLGPYDVSAQEPVFEATVQALASEGYGVLRSDPERGLVLVAAETRPDRTTEAPIIEIQLYREGWVACRARLDAGASRRTTNRVGLEVEALAVRIAEHLERQGIAARAR